MIIIIITKTFINKFSYKHKFTEYDLPLLKVIIIIIIITIIIIIIIIIIKKPIYNLFQLKKKERLFSNTISVGGDYFQAKCSCEEIAKKKQMA